jgi:hypothetical protein
MTVQDVRLALERNSRSRASRPPVILQSTHEAALDVFDLKRDALELS